jgi:hypothetical protein
MEQVITDEFPFVNTIPLRQKSRLRRAWDLFQELSAAHDKYGPMCPASLASKILDVSPQRVSQLMDTGQLAFVNIAGHNYVTKDSLVAYCNSERKAGRPVKVDSLSKKDIWKISKDVVKNKS